MIPRIILLISFKKMVAVLNGLVLILFMAGCGGGGGGSDDPQQPDPAESVIVSGTVDDGTPNSPISNAICSFVDLNGEVLAENIRAHDNGNFSINILPDKEGHIRCYPPGVKKLILSTYLSTKGRSAGDKISGENVTPPTTVVADIINSENPAVPEARKLELLNAIENDEDPELSLLVDLSTSLYKAMLSKQIDVRFGGDDGIDPPGAGLGGGGGVGGDAGDGADFSPIPNARCEFVAMELEGDDLFAPDLKEGEVLLDAALADFCDDGMVNRPDLGAIAEQMNQAFEGRQTEIMAAIANHFSECIGQPYPYRTTADGEDSETPGSYFLPIPPNLQGFVRCTPPNQPELKLATYVSTEGLAEDEKLDGQDVKPETTFFSNNIANKLYDDLSTVKENYLEDIAGLGDIHIEKDGETITGFELQGNADPNDEDVGLVAFSATSLFNILYKNESDADYLALLNDLIQKKKIDPEDLKDVGILEEDAENWSKVVNDSNEKAGEDLGTDLDRALSTARIKVTVLDRPGGVGIAGAEVDITDAPSGVECEDCPADTDDNGEVTLTLTGVGTEAILIEVEASSVAGFESTTRTTEVVAFATVDLEIPVSYKLTVQGGGTGNGRVTSIPSGISCDINGGVPSGDCSANYDSDTEVTLTAEPLEDEDSTFDGWSEDPDCADGVVTMDSEITCTAAFALIPKSLDWYRDADEDGYGDPNDSIYSETQPEGYVGDNTDCNDNDAAVNPGASEVPYNGKDDDCDAATADDDLDGDGYPIATDCDDTDAAVNPGATEILFNGKDDDCDPATTDSPLDIDNDGDGYTENQGDCNDANANVNPGATEICNGIDDNCANGIDEGLSTDADGDGHYTFGSCLTPADDCDDTSDSVYPGATEILDNGKDDDCDPATPDSPLDIDNDGDGYTENQGDCNDANANVNPGATEVCNGIDDNCANGIDEGLSTDADGDGHYTFGSCLTPADDCDDTSDSVYPGATEICGDGIDQDCSGADLSCDDVDNDGDGYSENQGDCNDANAYVNPGATEVCNGIDDNCANGIDEGLSTDADGDGHYTFGSCLTPADDCDDTSDSVYPGATEICGDGIDQDCSGADLSCDDVDNDGDGYSENQGDCNDANAYVNPGATEVCNGIDDNCANGIDEGLSTDADGDGHYTFGSCLTPADDCDDTSDSVYPGATEICGDGIDQDCSGADLSCDDVDNDGDGYSENQGDCNDANAYVNPGATEVCNGIDDNCANGIDEGLSTDADGDGHYTFGSCLTPADDCDDTSDSVYPGATEVCNGIDDNCANGIDEGCVEDCLDFDPYDVYIVPEGDQWLLTDGIMRMLVFPNEEEALQARDTIQYYWMDSQCFIGRPDSSMEYWLVSGRSPIGQFDNEDCLYFDPYNVYIVQEDSQWLLTDGIMRMLVFPNEEEAIQARNTIQSYGFSYQCFIGRPDSSMKYWRRSALL